VSSGCESLARALTDPKKPGDLAEWAIVATIDGARVYPQIGFWRIGAKFEGLGDLAVITIVIILGTGLGVSFVFSARAGRCEALRDHLVELRLTQTTNVDHAAHRAAMRRALGDTFVTDCQTMLTARDVDCALNATDTATAVACTAATSWRSSSTGLHGR
jgi:hypothetical protein